MFTRWVEIKFPQIITSSPLSTFPVKHCRLVSVCRRPNLHGLLLNLRPSTGQGLAIIKTPLCQRHSLLSRMGGTLLLWYSRHASDIRSGHERDAERGIEGEWNRGFYCCKFDIFPPAAAHERIQYQQRAPRAVSVRSEIQRATLRDPLRRRILKEAKAAIQAGTNSLHHVNGINSFKYRFNLYVHVCKIC